MAHEQEFPEVGHRHQLILKHILEHTARMHPEGEIVYGCSDAHGKSSVSP